jgi:broad specificity phosphatase PhoE
MLRLVLVRHGQTDANLNHMLQGQSDGELNAIGIQQVEELGRRLKDFHIDQVIVSTMRRAQDTAVAIARHHQLKVITTPLIVEWNCGVLDGVPAEVFRKKLQEADVPLSSFRPEGGETLVEVQQRAAAFLSDVIANYQDQTVLVCSHGDFMRALMGLLLRISIEDASGIYFDNASYSILEFENGHWNAVTLNQSSEKSDQFML